MKVLIVAHYYPPHVGGIELVAKHQAHRIAAAGHTITVVTSKVSQYEHDEHETVSLIRIPALNILERWGVPFPIFSPRIITELVRQVRQHDIVHVHDAFYISSLVAVLCARWYRKPVVLTQHVEMIKHPSRVVMIAQKLVYATTGKIVFAASNIVITLNDRVASFLEQHGVAHEKIVNLPNGVDTTLFHPASLEEKRAARTHFGLDPERRIVLFVGRFVPKKGFDALLAAQSDAYQIVFVGGARPASVVESPHVVFLGSLAHEALPDLYRAADVFVLPSEAEGFPLSVQEAMASGLPVITSNDPGYMRYGFDRNGICLLDDRNSSSIGTAIIAILNNVEATTAMSEYSRNYATEHFGWDRVTSSLLSVYEGLLQPKKARRIMIVVPRFYPKIGGVENYAYHLARRLHEEGRYHVSIVTSNPDAGAKKYTRGELDGMTMHYLPVWKTLSNTPLHPLWFFMMRRIIKTERPDLINVHSPVPYLADMAAYAAGTIPVVLTYHSGSMIKHDGSRLINTIIGVYEKIFLRILLYKAAAIVAVSYAFLQKTWPKKLADKMMLIRPGVDTAYFTPTPLPVARTITYVGRIEHTSSWKGIEQLLQAIALVRERCPDARLELVGSGDAVEHYARRAQELGITDAVTFCGALAGQGLVDAYRRARVIVLPSTSEAEQSSVVLIEAMASGRPVIGTRIGGTPYIVTDSENGLLVPPRDPAALADALERILTDDDLANRLAAGALASAQKVDWRIQVEKYATLFFSLMQKREHITTTPASSQTQATRTYTFSRTRVVSLVALWWGLFSILSLNNDNPLGLLNIIGFTFLLLVPGFFTLSCMRLSGIEPWGRFSLMIAVSILELIIGALVANTILPLIGVMHPLAKAPLLAAISLLTALLATLFWKYNTADHTVTLKRYILFSCRTDALFGYAPLGLVALAIAGAVRLNNGADNSVTIIMLVLAGAYIGWLAWASYRKKINDPLTIPFALWGVSLALLLMTSLRGWHIAGHDVQVEFWVFELAKNNGRWFIESYRNAYNACMSITVLPTIFASLLKLPDPYVYKVLFQIIFAVVPGVIYVFVRKYVGSAIALLASFYFIAFPTFFTDMSMLNRQEIAFLFWAVMLYVLFEDRLALRLRQVLFVVLGFGMILSHYSTTYTVIALIAFLVMARFAVRTFMRWQWFMKLSGRAAITLPDASYKPYVTIWMLAALVAGSFLWTSVLTDTSSGSLYRVISKTVETIRENSKEDTRSSDVLYSIFSWGTTDPQKSLALYAEKTANPMRAQATIDTYYDTAMYYDYDLLAVNDKDIPLTGLGHAMASWGIDVSKTNDSIRQILAKVLQVLMMVGFLSVLLRRRFLAVPLNAEFFLFAVGNVLMVASQVILPVLSAEYGVLRAFEQSLMFLGILVVIGGMSLSIGLSDRTRFIIATTFAIVFFYSMSGVFAQWFVREPTQLHLSNAGMYYDAYYTHDSELQAVGWLHDIIPKNPDIIIQTDLTATDALRSVENAQVIQGIYPALVHRDSYVLLNYANVHKSQSMILWNSNVVRYRYPTAFLDTQKDLLYNNGDVKIYR